MLLISQKLEYPWNLLRYIFPLKQVCHTWCEFFTDQNISNITTIPLIHIATYTGNLSEMIRLKLYEKQSILAPDNDGWIPSDYAYFAHRVSPLKLLQIADATSHTHEYEFLNRPYSIKESIEILTKDDIHAMLPILLQNDTIKIKFLNRLYKSNTTHTWSQTGRDYIKFIAHCMIEREAFRLVKENDLKNFKIILQKINAYGANINAYNRHGNTLLHEACAHWQCAKIVRELLAFPVIDVDKQTSKIAKRTALQLAIVHGNEYAAHLLLESNKCDICIANAFGQTALHVAASKDAVTILKSLLSYNSAKPNFNIIKPSIVDARDNENSSPLEYAVAYDAPSAVEFLIKENADTTIEDQDGNNLMHLAVHYDSNSCIPVLARMCKYVINKPNKAGATPLLNAAKDTTRQSLIPWLIAHGANVNHQDNSGNAALHYVTDSDTIRLLYERGANLNIRTTKAPAYHIHCGYTPLHFAALRGNLECVKTLIELGADITQQASDGMTPERVAYEFGNMHVAEHLKQVEYTRAFERNVDKENPSS